MYNKIYKKNKQNVL